MVDALGAAPTVHAPPVGNAGNITATWMGYQASGAAPAILGIPGGRCSGLVRQASGHTSRDHRHRHPDRQPGFMENGTGRTGQVRWPDRRGDERSDHERLCTARFPLGVARGTSISSAGRRTCAHRDDLPEGIVVCTVTGHPDSKTRIRRSALR